MQNVIYKLGKKAVRHDARTLLFGAYATAELPAPPTIFDWSNKVSNWGMMGNDRIGDCTCAALGHLIMEWTADCGVQVTPSDADVIKAYSDITGYNPTTGLNDNGANELDVLNYARKTGIAGHVIGGYASLGSSILHAKQSIWLFGGAYLGLAMPSVWQGKSQWDAPADENGVNEPGSWGGHAVPAVGFDADYAYVITWGGVLKLSWAAYAMYCDEAYALLSPDFVTGEKAAPNGFMMNELVADMTTITQQTV